MLTMDFGEYRKERARIEAEIRDLCEILALNAGTSNEEAIRRNIAEAKARLAALDRMANDGNREYPTPAAQLYHLRQAQVRAESQAAHEAESRKLLARETVREMEKNGLVVRPRSDKGGKHGKTARGWRTQADVAADFSLSAKRIGGRWYGKVTEDKVKDWESRYPDETKRERKSGYHAGLRNCPNPTPEIKQAYLDAAANWNDHWKKYNKAFLAWLKTNPNGDYATFRKVWQRSGKTVHRNDTDKTTRYGADMSFANALDSGDFDNGT